MMIQSDSHFSGGLRPSVRYGSVNQSSMTHLFYLSCGCSPIDLCSSDWLLSYQPMCQWYMGMSQDRPATLMNFKKRTTHAILGPYSTIYHIYMYIITHIRALSLSISISISIYIYISISISISIYLSLSLSIDLSSYLSIYLSIYLYIYIHTYTNICVITFIFTSPSLVSIPNVRAERRYHGPLLARGRQVRTAEGPAMAWWPSCGKSMGNGKHTVKNTENTAKSARIAAFSWEKDETWWENHLSMEVFSWENMGTSVFNGILMGVNGT